MFLHLCFFHIGLVDSALCMEPITEERAARTLYRIELLRKIREQVLCHPLLKERLKLCRPSLYLPVWWECGKHDRDLLIGVAKHGLSRTDFYILNDSQLSFLDAHRKYVLKENHGYSISGMPHQHSCLYNTSLGHCRSPESSDYHRTPLHPTQLHQDIDMHGHKEALEMVKEAENRLGKGPYSRESILSCTPVDDSMELGHLQHEESLHTKSNKDISGFPFNSASAGHNMLNSYGIQGELNGAPGDMAESIAEKLRNDVLVGEQGSSEETELIAPSVELDELQTPWESSDHAESSDIFNDADPMLGTPTLEGGFLDATKPEDGHGQNDPLKDCFDMPHSVSQSKSVEPLTESFMLFKEIHAVETPMNHSDLLANAPEIYPSQPFALSDVGIGQADTISEELEKLTGSEITLCDNTPDDRPNQVKYKFVNHSESCLSNLEIDERENRSKRTQSRNSSMPLKECLVKNTLKPLKLKQNVSIRVLNEDQLKDSCGVSLEQPCEKHFMNSFKVPFEEPHKMSLKEPLEELFKQSTQNATEELLNKGDYSESTAEYTEPVENTSDIPAFQTEEDLPSSSSLVPALSNKEVDSTVFKYHEDIKNEPESTTLNHNLEQAACLQAKDDMKEEKTKTLGTVNLLSHFFYICNI